MWTSQPLLEQPCNHNFDTTTTSCKSHDDPNASIEAVWLPDGRNNNTDSPNNHDMNNVSKKARALQAPPSPPSKLQLRVKAAAKHILAALSFETNHDIDEAVTGKAEKKHVKKGGVVGGLLRRRTTKKSQRGIVPSHDDGGQRRLDNHNNITRVECGSSSGSSNDDVFFDALQYGDASGNQDDFDRDKLHPRESIVLSGITVTVRENNNNGGGGGDDSDLWQQQHHQHDIETVLRSRATASDDDEDDDDNTTTSSPCSSDDATTASTTDHHKDGQRRQRQVQQQRPAASPPPPRELPLRFLRAGKNDPVEGLRRYESTLQMRLEQRLDHILREPNFDFGAIKQHYPHYCHCRGKNGEPCFYEQPPRTNLKALQQVGVTVDKLLRHYTMVTEYQWQYLERDDLAKSIYIIDLQGIRLTDFAGEAVEFLKKASKFSAEHYPERAGCVFVINVPGWFKIIWNVVKPIIDESTLKKIYILRGKDEIRTNMQEKIALENIPPEYGGTGPRLGESIEEQTLAAWVEHNNQLATAGLTACPASTEHCRFCDWTPARSY
jgi:hypothetical protein